MPAHFIPNNFLTPFSWQELFVNNRSVELDVGCGDGRFLIQVAQKYPDKNFLGIERLLGRVRKIDRTANLKSMSNVKVLRLESSYAVKYLVPARSVSVIHFYFPDPFPKKKQFKRRVFTDTFCGSLSDALISQGLLRIRTDHAGYFEVITETLSRHSGFKAVDLPDPDLDLQTDFERFFIAEGRQVYRACYHKV